MTGRQTKIAKNILNLKKRIAIKSGYGEKIKYAAAAFDTRLKKKDGSREVNGTYYEYECGGEFRTGVQYANVMEHLGLIRFLRG